MSSLPVTPSVPGAHERSLEALSKPGIDRNAFTLAIIACLVGGACFGAMAADFSARTTDIGYESSSLADSLTGALFLGGLLNILVSLVSFANARANAGFLALLLFGAISAAPIGSGLTNELLPRWWNVECNHGNARACHAVKRVSDGITADKKLCAEARWDGRPCERLLEHDGANAASYCAAWRTECKEHPTNYGNSKCDVATRRCPKAHQPIDSDDDRDSTLDPE